MCRLHKAVSNPHLVKLYSYFEDSNFVYIVLELCRFLTLLYETLFYVCTIKFVGANQNGVLYQEAKLDGATQETESHYRARIKIFCSSGQ